MPRTPEEIIDQQLRHHEEELPKVQELLANAGTPEEKSIYQRSVDAINKHLNWLRAFDQGRQVQIGYFGPTPSISRIAGYRRPPQCSRHRAARVSGAGPPTSGRAARTTAALAVAERDRVDPVSPVAGRRVMTSGGGIAGVRTTAAFVWAPSALPEADVVRTPAIPPPSSLFALPTAGQPTQVTRALGPSQTPACMIAQSRPAGPSNKAAPEVGHGIIGQS